MPDPDLPSPPINSLPPLRCPPGRDGIGLLPAGELGDCGGLAIPVSGCATADGLNEKLGSGKGAARDVPMCELDPNPGPGPGNSNADFCRLPVAREYEEGADEGAEEGAWRAGKINGGFGRGPEGLSIGDD